MSKGQGKWWRGALLLLVGAAVAVGGGEWGQGVRAASLPAFDPSSCTTGTDTGVPVCWKTDPQMFPAEWSAPPIRAEATDLMPSEKERAVRLITRATSRYPASLLRSHLGAIYLVGELRFSGIEAGGTNSWDRVYLHDGGAANGFSDEFLEGAFHQEFSSVLLRRHAHLWNEAAWESCNPPSFVYGTTGTEAVREHRASTDLDPALMARGFLNQYATASPEEDFNETVEYLFMHPASERISLAPYPKLRRKTELVRGFYAHLGVVL